MHTRPVYHRSFEPFKCFIAKGSKAKLNIGPSPTDIHHPPEMPWCTSYTGE